MQFVVDDDDIQISLIFTKATTTYPHYYLILKIKIRDLRRAALRSPTTSDARQRNDTKDHEAYLLKLCEQFFKIRIERWIM